MLDHFLEEKRKAEKLVLVRYQEYNATILGAGYYGAMERLHRAIARYECLRGQVEEMKKS